MAAYSCLLPPLSHTSDCFTLFLLCLHCIQSIYHSVIIILNNRVCGPRICIRKEEERESKTFLKVTEKMMEKKAQQMRVNWKRPFVSLLTIKLCLRTMKRIFGSRYTSAPAHKNLIIGEPNRAIVYYPVNSERNG